MDRNYDPVIVFSFSKKECESLAMQMASLDLNSEDEKKMVSSIFHRCADFSPAAPRTPAPSAPFGIRSPHPSTPSLPRAAPWTCCPRRIASCPRSRTSSRCSCAALACTTLVRSKSRSAPAPSRRDARPSPPQGVPGPSLDGPGAFCRGFALRLLARHLSTPLHFLPRPECAGLLPLIKELVEILFSEGLLKARRGHGVRQEGGAREGGRR